jgi:hypothetical protein
VPISPEHDDMVLRAQRAERRSRGPVGLSPDLAALRVESDRLFAEHRRLREVNQRVQAALERQLQEVNDLQKAAYAAEEQTWQSWSDARDALQEQPGDLSLVSAADQAEAAYDAARTAAHAAQQETSARAGRLLDESWRNTKRLLDLGEQARAAQDAFLAAYLEKPQPTDVAARGDEAFPDGEDEEAPWTTAEVLAYLAQRGRTISASTWLAYVSRGQAPAATYVGRTPTWTPAQVAEWHTTRTRGKAGAGGAAAKGGR